MPTRSAPTSPGPCVTPIASTSESCIPACATASRTTGTICRKCSRDASSGTTPPYFRQISICDDTTLDRTSRPSTTTAAAVSSQEDSIPNILKLTLCFPLLPYASTRSPRSYFAPASESRDAPLVTFPQNYGFARIDKITPSRLLCTSEL